MSSKSSHQKIGAIIKSELESLRNRAITNLEAMKTLEKKFRKRGKLKTYHIGRVTVQTSVEDSVLIKYVEDEERRPAEEVRPIEV